MQQSKINAGYIEFWVTSATSTGIVFRILVPTLCKGQSTDWENSEKIFPDDSIDS